MRFHALISMSVWLMINPTGIAGEETGFQIFPVKASQGVAVDAKHFYAISNRTITKHEKKTGAKIAAWEANPDNPTQAHFMHMNSGTVIDGKLYAAHSRFPTAPNENTIEIFDVNGDTLKHVTTIQMGGVHGSFTWIDRKDDSWWMCFAVYGKPENRKTKLVRYHLENGTFIEQQAWLFAEETLGKWGTMSCSGGSWGPDGNLYVTGHDNAEVHVLAADATSTLLHLRTIPVAGIYGQAIAWDRTAETPTLWGIVKNKHVSVTRIPLQPK
ncbi:MAG: hypothetical protein RL346_580 [Verrucomicrobiota bacterium]